MALRPEEQILDPARGVDFEESKRRHEGEKVTKLRRRGPEVTITKRARDAVLREKVRLRSLKPSTHIEPKKFVTK